MRVGVCLGDFVPEVGGGYTFVSQIFDAFLKLAHVSSHQFVVFCNSEHVKSLQAGCENPMLEFCGVPEKGFVETAISALKHYSPLFAYLYKRGSRFERAASERHVEFVWFVGGGVYDTPEIPYIATVWDVQHLTHPWFPEVSSEGRWDYRELMHKRFLRRAAYVITGTRTGAEQLGWYYQVPEDRIRILPHPTPLLTAERVYSKPACANRLGGKKFIFYPAQFWPHKNHVNLLHALKLLHDRYDLDVNLVFTGSDKNNSDHVKSVVGELGLASQIHILGFVGTDELVWLYRNAVALVYPSFSGPENLPPLEAFSLGCPVVISDYPGAREQLGDAAVFFDPHSPEKMADAVKYLLDNPDLKQDLIKKGYERAVRWTAEDFVEGVFSMFDEFEPVRRCWS
ncbi:MAG: glycosyltransferase family 4 protein [Gammaproteobacteria bacterium]|nr:glycosyltransferase family 4 protein [Gammaproteobacteria bacterium]